jgi:CubicO group peptidase (beta-lactamase class C family)
MRSPSRPLLALLLVLIAAFCVVATAPARADAREQEQERIALEWIEAHNAGDVEAMRRFRELHFRRSEVSDWESGYLRMVERLGKLDVYGVMIEESGELLVGVRPQHGEGRVRLAFAFHDDAPDQLRQIALVDAGDGGGGSLPELTLDGDRKRRAEQLDAYLRELASQGLFSGSVLIATPDGVGFEQAYGLASREFAAANGTGTRFDVGSCNKDYTRAAILQLRAAGKLGLDDSVGQYLPDYPNPDVRERVTIRQLLEHRSGLGDYFTDEWWQTPMSRLREVDDYIPIWGPKPLLSEPGERERYSNFGYTVLGAIIERVSGQSYPDYVTEHVFEPAGMTRSGFFETDAVVPDVAVGYTRMSPAGERAEPVKNIYVEPAKGGPWGKSYSTARDLYRFYAAMLDGRIVEGDDNWLAGSWSERGFALGGAGPGLNAMVVLEDGTMVVVLANMDPPIAEDLALTISRAVRG